MKNVLVTRPKETADEITRLLESGGYNVFVEPLFFVEKLEVAPKKSAEISAVIITSANACFALKTSGISKDVKIFAVGKKTAQKLREDGFNNIAVSPKNAAGPLKDLIIETHHDKSGLILYFHGSVTSLDFTAELKKSGFNARDILAYKTTEHKNFSEDFLNFAAKNSFDEILIFSQNSAEIFFNLAKKHNLLEYFSNARILCLSEKILSCMKNFGFKNLSLFSEIPILKNFYD